MDSCPWMDAVLDAPSAESAWQSLLERLHGVARESTSPTELHNLTIAPDRLLSESAWELWAGYLRAAPRTTQALREWWSSPAAGGRAVLVVDALSLRELPLLVGGAERREVALTATRVTGSEVPSDTEQFAKALGVASRSQFANNGAPATFALASDSLHTDVLSMPFEDCVGLIPHERDVFIWHTWLDDLIHLHRSLPDQISRHAVTELQGDGFWRLVDRLRQGRKLVITGDHGYAVARLFSSEETEREVIEALRETFGASRYAPAGEGWQRHLMPPLVLREGGFLVMMGQRKWRVQGGFPHVVHGGLSLLEVAVPFIELPPL